MIAAQSLTAGFVRCSPGGITSPVTATLEESARVEIRHVNALRRIYQADRMLADDGRDPRSFLLIHRGPTQREIDHPRWDPSWAVPDEQTIDDLEEMRLLRVEPHFDKRRTFTLTMRGRQEAEAVDEQHARAAPSGGRAPSALEVLRWLVTVAADEPGCFDTPERLLDSAVSSQMVDVTGREPLAQRILGLIPQGYLRGEVPELALGTAQQRLARTRNLELTVAAEHFLTPPVASTGSVVMIIGDVIGSQVAAGDITNYVTFNDVLDRAYAELEALDDIDPEAKAEAQGLLERLRARAVTGAGEIMTGAGGAIAAGVIARLLGLPHG